MKYTLNIPDKLNTVFRGLAEEEGITLSELFRRALLTYAVLRKEQEQGRAVAIIKDGRVEKELVLII